MIIWTEKRIRQIFKEELDKVVSGIHEQEEILSKLLKKVGKDYADLARDVANLKSQKVVDSIGQSLKPKRGRGRPRKRKNN